MSFQFTSTGAVGIQQAGQYYILFQMARDIEVVDSQLRNGYFLTCLLSLNSPNQQYCTTLICIYETQHCCHCCCHILQQCPAYQENATYAHLLLYHFFTVAISLLELA